MSELSGMYHDVEEKINEVLDIVAVRKIKMRSMELHTIKNCICYIESFLQIKSFRKKRRKKQFFKIQWESDLQAML